MRGIRVLQGHPAALSILTTHRERPEDRPYEDNIGPDGYPRYKWQGSDPQASDNVALRVAMELSHSVVRGCSPRVVRDFRGAMIGRGERVCSSRRAISPEMRAWRPPELERHQSISLMVTDYVTF